MFGISSVEFGVIFLIGLLLVGPKQLPEVLRALGRFYRQMNLFITKMKHTLDDTLYDSESLADKAKNFLETKEDKTPTEEKEKTDV